jgi:rhamnulokinase
MTTANFLAFDLGASSGRALLGRWDGTRFALEELHRFTNGPIETLGSLHWDVLRLWQDIKTGMACYSAQYDTPLLGIGIDTWGVDYALLDQRGRLLGNPYNYRDTRTDGMLAYVAQLVPEAELFQRTGLQFLPINTIYQLASMAREQDAQLAAANSMLMMPDLFHYWLTGYQAVEYTNASTTQLLDCHSRTWARDLAERIGIPARIFPELVGPGTALGKLQPAIASEVGLRELPIIYTPATHDTGSAVAAVPGLDAHSAYISSGTWSLMGLELPEPIVTPAARQLNITNEGGVNGTIRLLKNINGLWLLQESRRQWQREGIEYSWEALLAAAEQSPPLLSLIDPDTAEFMRPGDLPNSIRAYCRQTQQIVPDGVGAIVRCILESLALKYRWVLQALERVSGQSIATIRIVGGGSHNRQLCQFTADACNLPVVAGPAEATALGNLLVQAIAAGMLPHIAAGRKALADSLVLDHYQPARQADWDAAFTKFNQLVG